jgi:uridine kinase
MGGVRIYIGDEVLSARPGPTAGELLLEAGVAPEELIAATLNRHLVALHTEVSAGAKLAPVMKTDPAARGVLQQTASLLLHAAAGQLYPTLRLVVGQSLLGGHFYELITEGGATLDPATVAERLSARIAEMCESDETPREWAIPVEAAPAELTDNEGSKARMLRTWTRPLVPVVGLGKFVDVRHGPIAPSLRLLKGVRVEAYAPGVILYLPGDEAPPGQRSGRLLYAAYRESRDWNRKLGVESVGDLNAAILGERGEDVMRISEALHEKKIAEIADTIASRGHALRFVCVSGPSSAGKTTFVKRLSVQLRVVGVDPVMIGLDDYYRNRDECPLDENGEYDFEALEALDLELIDDHVAALYRGDEIEVPSFSFATGKRKDEPGRTLRLSEGKVALIEGIHGLNPRILQAAPRESAFFIYLNALTQLVIDEHNRIFTADSRLLRRIVRDRRYRQTPAAESIERWHSVRRGERKHIFPFQEEADATFNTALVYETPVLKTFAWRYLLEVPRSHPSATEAHRLLQFLELFVPVFPDAVPHTSVLREFIGGSGFSY